MSPGVVVLTGSRSFFVLARDLAEPPSQLDFQPRQSYNPSLMISVGAESRVER